MYCENEKIGYFTSLIRFVGSAIEQNYIVNVLQSDHYLRAQSPEIKLLFVLGSSSPAIHGVCRSYFLNTESDIRKKASLF